MARVLFLYSSFYGQARKVCERLQSRLAEQGHAADVVSIAEPGPDPAGYDAIVIGASIRHGKHKPAVMEFIHKHRALLDAKPSAFFSVSLVARKPGKDTAETNPYTRGRSSCARRGSRKRPRCSAACSTASATGSSTAT